MNVRINLKRQSRMHIPGTQAALITRPRTKTNKAKHEQKVKKIINTDIKMREWSHVLTKDITVHVSYNTPALLLVVKSVKSRTCNRWKKRIHIQGKISIVIWKKRFFLTATSAWRRSYILCILNRNVLLYLYSRVTVKVQKCKKCLRILKG